ncbi:hypothetical protein EVAR_75598_1 [Eumeta japonica]|uniref:Uncharacterized protein n=1 Tax=Eumeta variegata TaxID=151549 RepID=A0A4C1U1B6_EUMVA|nr:hypothetical protein EVAR_75598_1 [Eumeta japonica]
MKGECGDERGSCVTERDGGARRRRRRRPPTASRLKGPRKKFCLQVIKKRPRKPDVADVHEWCSAATEMVLPLLGSDSGLISDSNPNPAVDSDSSPALDWNVSFTFYFDSRFAPFLIAPSRFRR